MTEPAEEPRKKKAPSKSVKKGTIVQGPLSIRWNLAELPSSQHKAGLAGLALCVQYLQRNPDAKGICQIEALDAGGLTLHVDRDGMQALFDEIYAASTEEQERDAPLKNKNKEIVPPNRTFERTDKDKKGKEKQKTIYVYEVTIPRGALIEEWDPAPAGAARLWLKLWRDVVWSILRGVPATREPYDCRAEKRQATDGYEAWDAIVAAPDEGVELPSTYFLGAQAKTAEYASFRDVVKHQVLLHFWPFITPIYVPAVVDRDGSREFNGFALAIPDVVDLEAFVQDWPIVIRERSHEASGYRPKDAVIDVAGEAGLDVVRRSLSVIRRKEGAVASRYALNAVDVFHIEKEGNNVRIRSVQRVDPRPDRADAYARSRAAYWSATFRRQRVSNVLNDKPWWHDFGRLCAQTPQHLTINDNKFRHDCRIAFTEIEMKESGPKEPKALEKLVYQAVRTYVLGRLASKHALKWSEVESNPSKKAEYEAKKEKIAREAFFAIRSRTGGDFVAYFTSTLCSVPQHFNEQSYLELAQSLTRETDIERIRNLTLLALSANS